ncbi:MAG TPA: hypothetical protein VJR89_14620 [Polyangiales bacterium]|nr:hypothetical protein [Polyangiales bacterium]
MRVLVLLCLGLSACAGSTPPVEDASKQSFADQQRERWKQQDAQSSAEARQRGFVSNSADRNAVQPQ